MQIGWTVRAVLRYFSKLIKGSASFFSYFAGKLMEREKNKENGPMMDLFFHLHCLPVSFDMFKWIITLLR